MIFSYRQLLILLFISTSFIGKIFAMGGIFPFPENSMASHSPIEELEREISELKKRISEYSLMESRSLSHIFEERKEILFFIEDIRFKLGGLHQRREVTDVERELFRSFNQAIVSASQVVAVKTCDYCFKKEIGLFDIKLLPAFIFYYDGMYTEEFQHTNSIFTNLALQARMECIVRLEKLLPAPRHKRKILDFCKNASRPEPFSRPTRWHRGEIRRSAPKTFAFAEDSTAFHSQMEELRQEINELKKRILKYSFLESYSLSHISEKKRVIVSFIEYLRSKLNSLLLQRGGITDMEKEVFRSFNQAVILASQVVAVKEGWRNDKEIKLFEMSFLPAFIFYYDSMYTEEFQYAKSVLFANLTLQARIECVVRREELISTPLAKGRGFGDCMRANAIDPIEQKGIHIDVYIYSHDNEEGVRVIEVLPTPSSWKRSGCGDKELCLRVKGAKPATTN